MSLHHVAGVKACDAPFCLIELNRRSNTCTRHSAPHPLCCLLYLDYSTVRHLKLRQAWERGEARTKQCDLQRRARTAIKASRSLPLLEFSPTELAHVAGCT